MALSVAIIRTKPKDLSLDQYLQLLRVNFSKTHEKYSEQLKNLKKSLLDAKKEIFYLKTQDQLKQTQISLDSAIGTANLSNTNEKQNEKLSNSKKFNEFNKQFCSNLDFITNLIKLKTIDKNFKKNQDINQETVCECLSQILEQIRTFLFEYEFFDEHSSAIITDTVDLNMTQINESKILPEGVLNIAFPLESILHSLQLFLNLYEIEWFYYLRNKLIDQIIVFINDLVKFMIQFETSKKFCALKLTCCSQILIILSTSDYLLNSVLNSSINGLQIALDYLCDLNRSNKNKKEGEIENLSGNCIHLCDCLVSIANIRQLDNYTPISSQIKGNINKILNTIFISLTDSFPLIAIQLSKLIQLLAIQNN